MDKEYNTIGIPRYAGELLGEWDITSVFPIMAAHMMAPYALSGSKRRQIGQVLQLQKHSRHLRGHRLRLGARRGLHASAPQPPPRPQVLQSLLRSGSARGDPPRARHSARYQVPSESQCCQNQPLLLRPRDGLCKDLHNESARKEPRW